jgi:hypothetical protein
MSDRLTDPVEAARLSYAEELRFTAHIRSPAVRTAFGRAARTLCRSSPWRVRSPRICQNIAASWRMHTKRMADVISTCRR